MNHSLFSIICLLPLLKLIEPRIKGLNTKNIQYVLNQVFLKSIIFIYISQYRQPVLFNKTGELESVETS